MREDAYLRQSLHGRARRLSTNWPQISVAERAPGVAACGDREPVCSATVVGRVGGLDGEPGRWDSDLMTQAAKKLLEEFDALQEGDRAEVLAELLRRVALAPHDLPDPDDLVSAADQIFLELDRREQSQ
jgi:hypothetical protein